MSQFDFGDLESPTSGSAFINNNLEPWRNALHSGHSGPSRPTYVAAGMRWIDTSNAGMWELKLFTGSSDIIEFYADTVNNLIIAANAGAASQVTYDNTDSGLSAETLQEAIDELQAQKATAAQGEKADSAVQPADLVFTQEFTSAQQVITPAGALTLAHGLGDIPRLVQVLLVNQTANQGYSPGDILFINPHLNDAGNTESRGVSIVPDATNLNVRYGSSASVFAILNKLTGVANIALNANWKMIIRAWK